MLDRFGKAVLPRKPFDDYPGPGEYDMIQLDNIRTSKNKTCLIGPISVLKTPPPKQKIEIPGPGAY